MSRWFRVDDGLVDDPKVQQLPDRLIVAMLNLWCITSQNGGNLPPREQIAFKLRITPAKAAKIVDELRAAGLIDEDNKGTRPHNWNGRQFKSDVTDPTAAERQRRHRNAKRDDTVTHTVTVTATRADTEQIRAEKKDSRAVADATRPDGFEEFWKAYPRREGANPKAPARKKFAAALKAGVTSSSIIAAAQRFSEETRSAGKIGTPYVAQAMTWLGQQRWGDYELRPEEPVQSSGFYAAATSEELQAWDDFRRATEGKTYPRDAKGGWNFPTQWPPNGEAHT